MQDLNEHTIPPGGWQFYQPETKWRAPTPIASTLNQTVVLIVAMRKQNPAITAKFTLATNPEAVKTEVLRFNRKRLGLPLEGTPVPFRVPRSSSNVARAVAAEARPVDALSGLKRAANGTAVGLEWLGKGAQTVPQELADKRARTCVECPKNVDGDWYVRAPAALIQKAIEAWKKLTGNAEFQFETQQGDKLKSCDVCKCLMRLKCFVPLNVILDKTSPEIMAEFPQNCWIARRDA